MAHDTPSRSVDVKWRDWALRPILVFVAAYTTNGILHELSHAMTAYYLGVRSTLFHFNVDVDLAHTTDYQRAVIGAAGPLVSLAFGLLCLFTYEKARGWSAELLLLYLSAFGIGMFLGNLRSVAFVGDFTNAAMALRLPETARYAATAVGGISLTGLMLWVGLELRHWVPAGVGRFRGMIGVIALPAVVGTASVILAYLPMPRSFAVARVTEGSFWVFAAVGALLRRSSSQESGRRLGLRWMECEVTFLAVLVIRMMVRGIPFEP